MNPVAANPVAFLQLHCVLQNELFHTVIWSGCLLMMFCNTNSLWNTINNAIVALLCDGYRSMPNTMNKGNRCVLPFHSDMVFGRRDKQTAKHKEYQLYCHHQFYHEYARARVHKSIYSNQCELNWLVGFVSIGFSKPLSTVRPLLSINCPQKCPNMCHRTCSAWHFGNAIEMRWSVQFIWIIILFEIFHVCSMHASHRIVSCYSSYAWCCLFH